MKRLLHIFSALLIVAHPLAATLSAQTPARPTPVSSAQQQQPPSMPGATQQRIEGNWLGILEAGANRLRLVLKLSVAADGQLKASIDSPDQNALGLTVDVVSFTEGMLRFEMKRLSAAYEGTISRDRLEILGTWRQGGNSLGLVFKRQDAVGRATSGSANVRRGRVELQPCGRDELPTDALCGQYEVFEDRASRTGRKVALNILLLPALAAKAAPDPLFYLAGGPGAGATSYAGAWFMTRLRQERDVVLVDQRGTGKSNPLQCNLYGDPKDMRGYFTDFYSEEALKACRSELERTANLALYTTPIAMDDLDEVRAALGYDRINLYGGSYGTTAALSYLRQYPKQVRAVAVFGVAPPDYKIPLPFAKGVQHAWERLVEDCAADAACHTAFPALRAEFDEILAKLDKAPVDVTAMNILTKQPQQLKLSRTAFTDIIRMMLYFPPTMSVLPLLIHQASMGNFAPLVGVAFQVITQIEGQIARGMQLSVVCAEDVPFITEQDVTRETAGTFYGETRLRAFIKACASWPKGTVARSFSAPVKATAPVLLVSGELDPVTPPWIAAAAARYLPNSRQVLIHYGSHYSYDCAENLVAEFIERGTTRGLDASCLEHIKRLPFNTGK